VLPMVSPLARSGRTAGETVDVGRLTSIRMGVAAADVGDTAKDVPGSELESKRGRERTSSYRLPTSILASGRLAHQRRRQWCERPRVEKKKIRWASSHTAYTPRTGPIAASSTRPGPASKLMIITPWMKGDGSGIAAGLNVTINCG